MKYNIILVLLVLNLVGCRHGMVTGSSRGIGGLVKPGSPVGITRPINSTKKPSLFVEEKNTLIKEVEPRSIDGSLFRIDDQRNYYYLSASPLEIGQFVDVRVVPIGTEDKKDEEEAGDASEVEESDDAFVKEMLASLPELDSGEKNPPLVKNIKMKVVDRFANGDVLLQYKRLSSKEDDGKEINVRTRVPYSQLTSDEALTTKHLEDVHWVDTLDGGLTTRYSSGWQDEYSLRMSGFSEAKSLFAAQLKNKEERLEETRSKLRNELVSFGKERKKLAREREDWIKKVNTSNTKVAELEKTVEDQTEELSKFKDDGPAENRDGAQGK